MNSVQELDFIPLDAGSASIEQAVEEIFQADTPAIVEAAEPACLLVSRNWLALEAGKSQGHST